MLMAHGVWRATLPTAWWRGGHSTPCNMTNVQGRGAPGLDAVMVTKLGWMPRWRHHGDRTSPDSLELAF